MKTNTELRQDVITELEWNSLIHNDIGVVAKDGAVTLTGVVETFAEKVAAERAVMRVGGVRAVADCLVVRLPDRGPAPDERTARANDVAREAKL